MRGRWAKSLGCWLGEPALPVGSHEGQASAPHSSRGLRRD